MKSRVLFFLGMVFCTAMFFAGFRILAGFGVLIAGIVYTVYEILRKPKMIIVGTCAFASSALLSNVFLIASVGRSANYGIIADCLTLFVIAYGFYWSFLSLTDGNPRVAIMVGIVFVVLVAVMLVVRYIVIPTYWPEIDTLINPMYGHVPSVWNNHNHEVMKKVIF
jgi:hypothetical protein